MTDSEAAAPETFLAERVTLHCGDCLDVLAAMPDNSVDSVVSDPPYGLEFMGKDWDKFAPRERKNATVWDGRRQAQEGWEEAAADRSGKGGGGPSYKSTHKGAKRCTTCGKRAFSGSPCECENPTWIIEHRQEAPAAMIGFQNFMEAVARELYRVLKPGGHLLMFGATKTYHRMACGVEDAGFEIRDALSWLYGSGFPKNVNLSKAIDKHLGAEREYVGEGPYASRKPQPYEGGVALNISVSDTRQGQPITLPATPEAKQWDGWGTALKPACELIVLARKPLAQNTIHENVLEHGTGGLNIDGCRIEGDKPATTRGAGGRHGRYGPLDAQGRIEDDGKGRYPANVIHDGSNEVAAGFPDTPSSARPNSKGRSYGAEGRAILGADRAREYQGGPDDGGGSAARFFYEVKPDCELIVLARKPLAENTIHENVLAHGTGALNIDGCRVEASGDDADKLAKNWDRDTFKDMRGGKIIGGINAGIACYTQGSELGRYPANVVTDGSDEVVGAFPVTPGSKAIIGVVRHGRSGGIMGKQGAIRDGRPEGYDDPGGSAARFFYTAKADDTDRMTSDHPTVKPVDLMQYLVRLVTQPGGTVLDPFAGTGTTGEAAWREGFKAILIERDPTYQGHIRVRLDMALASDRQRRATVKAAKVKSGRKKATELPLFGNDPA